MQITPLRQIRSEFVLKMVLTEISFNRSSGLRLRSWETQGTVSEVKITHIPSTISSDMEEEWLEHITDSHSSRIQV